MVPDQERALVERGITRAAARKLLQELPPDYELARTLEWIGQQIANNRAKIQNPAGFVYTLLSSHVTPPAVWQSRAEIAAAAAEKKAAEERAAAEAIAQQHAEMDAYTQADAAIEELERDHPARAAEVRRRAVAELERSHPRDFPAWKAKMSREQFARLVRDHAVNLYAQELLATSGAIRSSAPSPENSSTVAK